jgi:NADPH:quinone reductase-like Zn-dependent oxidoreductase
VFWLARDYLVSRFDGIKPNGDVADLRLVKAKLTEKCPDSISPLQARGLPASAMAAKKIVRDCMEKGDRVLVIGRSGGVGSCVLQHTKRYKANFVAAVSTQTEQCLQLGSDRVIDYREQKWWKIPEFEETKFDFVFDLVNGENWVTRAYAGTAISRKGTYAALMSGVDTYLEVHGIFDIIKLSCVWIGRMLWSRLHPRLPRWVAPEGLTPEEGDLKAFLKMWQRDSLYQSLTRLHLLILQRKAYEKQCSCKNLDILMERLSSRSTRPKSN